MKRENWIVFWRAIIVSTKINSFTLCQNSELGQLVTLRKGILDSVWQDLTFFEGL